MYCYRISSPNYDGTYSMFLRHEQCFTPEEFEAKVLACTPDAVRDRLNQFAEIDAKTGREVYVMWMHVVDDVVDALCARDGFTRLEWDAVYCPHGMTVVAGDRSYRTPEESDLERRLREYVAARGIL